MRGKARGRRERSEVDERKMRAHLREVVRRRVEQTLNALLDAEDHAPGRALRTHGSVQHANKLL